MHYLYTFAVLTPILRHGPPAITTIFEHVPEGVTAMRLSRKTNSHTNDGDGLGIPTTSLWRSCHVDLQGDVIIYVK